MRYFFPKEGRLGKEMRVLSKSKLAIPFPNILRLLITNRVHVGGVFGTSGSPRGLKTAVSSPDLSWVKDTNGSFRGVETNDKYAKLISWNLYLYKTQILTRKNRRTTPSLGVPQLTPLLAHPLRSIRYILMPRNSARNTCEANNTPHTVPPHL